MSHAPCAHAELEEEEVIRTLQSLAQMGESTVLLQEPRRQRQIKPSDVFTVNDKFRSKLTRITINAVQIRETATEAKATEERVAEERQYALDACIVRIMKARKRMSHAELVSEVMQQSKVRLRLAASRFATLTGWPRAVPHEQPRHQEAHPGPDRARLS
jgi:cullin-4